MTTQLKATTAEGRGFAVPLVLPAGKDGPGVLLLSDAEHLAGMGALAARYAADGYVVGILDLSSRPAVPSDDAIEDVRAAIAALRSLPGLRGGLGIVGFGAAATVAALAAARTDVDCAVAYYGEGLAAVADELDTVSVPLGFHFGSEDERCAADLSAARELAGRHGNVTVWAYPGAGHGFAATFQPGFHAAAEELAYIRSLTVVRGTIGPKFDLEAQWDAHMYHEFVTKDAHAVLDTMVEDPYVNITSTVMGGVGREMLLRFYKYHFCDVHPDDTTVIPVSRTVGVNRVVDELIMCFTHDREIPWLLPGIAPTGRHIELAMIAVVSFRSGKIYNEHIYFDQASVLVQAGLLEPGTLPVAGIEVSRKLQDKSIEPNRLMKSWASSESLPLSR